jgi:hypothetical protein
MITILRHLLVACSCALVSACAAGDEGWVLSNDAGLTDVSGDATETGIIGVDGFTCPPSQNRGSNGNYIMSNGCKPIQGASVTVTITQDIVATSGFDFQFNAMGLVTNAISWQQYVLAFDQTGNLYALVNNWEVPNQVFNKWVYLVAMPQRPDDTYYVPTGYEFTISLSSDAHDNITGAAYVVTDNVGTVLVSYNLSLDQINQADGGPYASGDIGPIGNITLDIVGFANGKSTVFTSGAGNIVYHADSSLSVSVSNDESCCYSVRTAETSNSMYGSLPVSTPIGDWVQGFTHCP